MEYQIVPSGISEAHIQSYSRLLSEVFSDTDKFTTAYLDWQYRKNPVGTVQGMDAMYGDTLAAHYVTIPVMYAIRGKSTKGLLSLNTATHPQHQGKGLFTKLANKTYEEGAKAGYQFVIGVANQNSTPGFLKKLGFTLIAPLEAKIGTGKMDFDPNTEYIIRSAWTDEALQWRISNPAAKYYRNGNTIICDTGKAGIFAQLYHTRQQVDLHEKSSLLKLWMGMAKGKIQKGIFTELPSMLRPSPLNLIFKDLSGTGFSFQKGDIFFELLDFDAY